MKDVLKLGAMYFMLGVGTITGLYTGAKIVDKLESKEKQMSDANKDNNINFKIEETE